MQDKDQQMIMVVDDVDINVDILVGALEDDYRIAVAMDGKSALESIASEPPDLILLDIMMPEMDGYEVCRRLKADPGTSGIPVIFVTAVSEIEDETKGFDLGAVDYITKPISPPIVRARVKSQLALRRAVTALERQNQELVGAARMREELDNIMRQNLKTPLSSIINLPRSLMAEDYLKPEHQDLLLAIEESGLKILDMINRSLDLYKMERNAYPLKPGPVDLLKIIPRAVQELHRSAVRRGIEFNLYKDKRTTGDWESFWVEGEKLLCHSMLTNLLRLLVEKTPENETVTITLENGGGPGVSIHTPWTPPPEVRDRLFEKPVDSGAGDDLDSRAYAARLMAETQGGAVSLFDAPQEGTTITISLKPVSADGMVEIGEPGESPAAEDGPDTDAPSKPSDPESGFRVTVDADFREMFINFLHEKSAELEAMRTALDKGDYEALRGWGIMLKSAGGMYDLEYWVRVGQTIEKSASERDYERLSGLLNQVDVFFEQVEVEFVMMD